jgi:hypothetical protein
MGTDPYIRTGYCVFGQVISGMDVVDAIAAYPVTDEVPDDNIIIHQATLSNAVCLDKLDGDINGDCTVNLADFAEMADNWLLCNAINLDCDTSMIE